MDDRAPSDTDATVHSGRIRDLVIEASGLVDRVTAVRDDHEAVASLNHLRAELLGLVNTVCDGDAVIDEACDAGCGTVEVIDAVLAHHGTDHRVGGAGTRSAA